MMAEPQDHQMLVFGGNSRRTAYTVAEYARHWKVAESTVRLWVRKKAVEYERTPGGGIRIIDSKR
jgi:hypothetical protein